MYVNQTLQVKWNNNVSEPFKVTNGVKQGGILSPVLFCIYVDGLLEKLKDSGVGCYIGPHYYGSLSYADDIVLLNPSVSGTNRMLRICEQYAKEHSILFNSKKSNVIVFSNSHRYVDTVSRILIINEPLTVCNQAKHLGHVLDTTAIGYVDTTCIQ